MQVILKKGGITVIKNDNNELIPTKTIIRWWVCIENSKLTDATHKDQFSLYFIDRILEKLVGHAYYYFLDGYSGYNQIAIVLENEENATYTCPYGSFAYRMSFGICNALITFQRCMVSIFSDMVKKFIEFFMNDFFFMIFCLIYIWFCSDITRLIQS